jgi:hypothetical protein
VEEKGVDVLLSSLPWAIGMIQTPWMENFCIAIGTKNNKIMEALNLQREQKQTSKKNNSTFFKPAIQKN